MKKVYILFLCSLVLFVTGCANDASKFKKEYESLNGTSYHDKEVRSLSIPKDNPFVYASVSDIVTKIDNQETFFVYFGFASCPWCRSMINNLINVVGDNAIKTIYYVDIKDVRDVIKLENGKLVKEKDASSDYYDLLFRLDAVLEDYVLTLENGTKVMTGEKRIYAPNVVAIYKGNAVSMTTGISDKLENPYMSLTDEINKESYDMLKDVIASNDSCEKKEC